MLPPAFEDKQPHTYGSLTLTLKRVDSHATEFVTVEPHFFGNAKYHHQITMGTMPVELEYTVATNLWHFYAYLSDCRTIPLIFTDKRGTVYSCDLSLQLLPSSQVLNRYNASLDYLFAPHSYLTNPQQTAKLYDKHRSAVGSV
jgi:hypothetical protein